jgi:hypothetical protein
MPRMPCCGHWGNLKRSWRWYWRGYGQVLFRAGLGLGSLGLCAGRPDLNIPKALVTVSEPNTSISQVSEIYVDIFEQYMWIQWTALSGLFIVVILS